MFRLATRGLAGIVPSLTAQLVERGGRPARSALPVFRRAGFSGPSPEPDVRLPPHPALHEFVPLVKRRCWSRSTVLGSSPRGSGSESSELLDNRTEQLFRCPWPLVEWSNSTWFAVYGYSEIAIPTLVRGCELARRRAATSDVLWPEFGSQPPRCYWR